MMTDKSTVGNGDDGRQQHAEHEIETPLRHQETSGIVRLGDIRQIALCNVMSRQRATFLPFVRGRHSEDDHSMVALSPRTDRFSPFHNRTHKETAYSVYQSQARQVTEHSCRCRSD